MFGSDLPGVLPSASETCQSSRGLTQHEAIVPETDHAHGRLAVPGQTALV